MNPLIISCFGTSIFVEKRRLIVKNSLENKHFEFYPHQIDHDSIVIDGHTGNITFEAMRWLMKHDISLILLNWNGNLLANTLPATPKSGKLRIKQYEKYLDGKTRMQIATSIVNQKISHTFNLFRELSNYYSEIDMMKIEKLFGLEKDNYSLQANKSINNLMNYEGRIATFYWNCLGAIFNKLSSDFNFKSRKNKSYSWNMNASDEVNALLNYGYAILESEVRKCINSIGLEPTVGFLHELADSKTPLVYDIQELFRWIIDLSVIQLLEEKKLKKADFIVTENYHIRLRESTANKLIEKISLNFNKKTDYKHGKQYSYQSILMDNVQQLANFLLDKKELTFEIPTMKIQRNDHLEIKQKILGMSPEERKGLGINKSTLWYQKRNLMAGKKIKVYNKILAKLG
jgi:CRISPR-associated protein Cas1